MNDFDKELVKFIDTMVKDNQASIDSYKRYAKKERLKDLLLEIIRDSIIPNSEKSIEQYTEQILEITGDK